jgi:hypothetical protein|tara:strand:+ start:108 stop:542 length:435 start_codon:yes stop_codon:yes gene_type:complete
MKSILDESEFWFLDQLNYAAAQLLIEVTEGIVSISPQDVSIDDLGTIKDARPIEITNQSRRVRIKFPNVLAYQVTDESYWSSKTDEEVARTILCTHRKSAYLQYVMENSIIKECVDGPVRHYSLSLADDIMEVITTTEPSIVLI